MIIKKINSLVMKATGHSDVMLALLLVLIISLMIVPIPKPLLDGLLALNLSLAICLLMVSLYIPSVISLSTFPSLLLFTTLFRLSLNVTTTRMILLEADAGKIIDTFGNFVVSGNFVVGLVIFLIILIIQFLVITKGAERVAEVAARFTLDAMPGKQMSIDADIKNGMISEEEGKINRRNLEVENKIYGSMDGAMKFVKGDAIAGLIIAAINIIAGFIIGVIQKGMSAGDAMQAYSILTIGDGLISQIPALLISITAGIVVTRVADNEKSALGNDIFAQFLGQPKALIIGGCLITLMAFIPGFPSMTFVVMGGGLIAFSVIVILNLKGGDLSSFRDPEPVIDEGDDYFNTDPLMIGISPDFPFETPKLEQMAKGVIASLIPQFGVPFPEIRMKILPRLEEDTYTFALHGLELFTQKYHSDSVIVFEEKEQINLVGIKDVSYFMDMGGREGFWVPKKHTPILEEKGFFFLQDEMILAAHLEVTLIENVKEFVGFQETRIILDHAKEDFKILVGELERLLTLQKITEVFQRLIEEGIALTQIRQIMETLIEWGEKEKDPVVLADCIRSSLKRYISQKYAEEDRQLYAYLFDPDIEEIVRQSIKKNISGSFLAIDPEKSKDILERTKSVLQANRLKKENYLFVTAMDVRRYMKILLEKEIKNIVVLSYQEISKNIEINPVGKISLENA